MTKTETIQTYKELLDAIPNWRYKARLFAAINPIGFVVMFGCFFPEYDAILAKLELSTRDLINKLEEGDDDTTG